ncbi:hypothetical protein [Siminovitchia terrae]|uniref:hypothetical protein n=1 Tax=Siminovitchia terrae TaxID=1914933 RepID=UPI001FD1BF0B|nr:hypothetical protein [Siminovitchia terrae]
MDDFIHPVFSVSMYDSYIQLSEKVNNLTEDAIITNDAGNFAGCIAIFPSTSRKHILV